MPNDSIATIKANVASSKSLTLNEQTIGASALAFLRQSFQPQTDFQFTVSDVKTTPDDRVTLSGTFDKLYSWNNVSGTITIFEPATTATVQRYCIFRVEVPGTYTASDYLIQYNPDANTLKIAQQILSNEDLKTYTGGTDFGLKVLTFCSIDSSVAETEDGRSDLAAYLKTTLGDDYAPAADGQGLIFPSYGLPSFQFTKNITVSPPESSFALDLDGFGFVLALDGEDGASEIWLNGCVHIQSLQFEMTADLDIQNQELQLALTSFPTLNQLAREANLAVDYFPESLSSLLDVRLTMLEITLDLALLRVSQVRFEISNQVMAAAAAFPQMWPDTGIKLEALNISGAVVNQSDSAGQDKKAAFIVAADITVSGGWSFDLAGKKYGLNPTAMGMSYSRWDDSPVLELSLDGKLTVANTPVYISTSYNSDDGWVLTGATAVDQGFNLSAILNDLLEGMSLPPKLPDLKLQNILFSVTPGAGAYSISAEVADPWTLPLLGSSAASLKVDRFAAQKMGPDLPITGELHISLTIGPVIVRLLARKGANADGGWQFEGSTGPGQSIPVGDLISYLSTTFGTENTLPAAITEFKIFQNLSVAFDTATKNFTFTGEADFPIGDTKTGPTVAMTVKIEVLNQQKSYTRYFSGKVNVLGMEFGVIFESEHLVTLPLKTQDIQRFIASYHDETGLTISIDDVINYFSGSNVSTTGLSFTVKDALLAYQKDTASKWLFGIDVEGGLDLSNVQVPGLSLFSTKPLPPDQTLKLSVTTLAATQKFGAEEIQNLSALKQGGLSLPSEGLSGVAFAALLRLGEQTMQLTLPVNAADLTPTGAGASAGLMALDSFSAEVVTEQNDVTWVSIQKSFGPLHFERVGIGYKDGSIIALLDADASIAGLNVSFDGLSIAAPLKELTTTVPKFGLRGLSIDYRNDPLEIAAAFLRMKSNGKDAYAGMATVRTSKLALSAIGSYTEVDGNPSLFIYAVADYPLGGPPFFFVTGFAGGLGYNRWLDPPDIDQVENFPLVSEALSPNGPQPLPSDQNARQTTVTNKLQQLERYVQPSVGDIFVAAGIKFTTFKQLESFALLIVKFGRRFEIDLLGISTLTVPAPGSGSTAAPVAQARLALEATFIPSEGILKVQGKLTPNSYIFDRKAVLSGGFAFYSWFSPHPNAGDFVLTLGGYHPKFSPPGHYPKVPRLALNWEYSSQLQIKGDAYFALTASALMVGAHMEATWRSASGKLRAWFNAGADFLIAWQPYYYDISVTVSIGVSYTYSLWGEHTVGFEVGASLHLWGPEFSGKATIDYWIVSFDVEFGAGARQAMQSIDWKTFKASFLPDKGVCSIAVQGGLIQQTKDANGKNLWIVNAKELVLATSSVIPINGVTGAGSDGAKAVLGSNKVFGVAPVGIEPNGTKGSTLTSTHAITIKFGSTDVSDKFSFSAVLKHVPAALWGVPRLDPNAPSSNGKKYLIPPGANDARFIENTLAGFEIKPKVQDNTPKTVVCTVNNEQPQPIPNAFSWRTATTNDLQGDSAWSAADATITDVQDKRASMLKALGFVNPYVVLGEQVTDYVLRSLQS